MSKPSTSARAPVDYRTVTVAAPASDTIEMLSPDGSIERVRQAQAGTLAALGYSEVTPEVRQKLADQAKFGGTLGEIGAGALGFARGASLGASDLAIRQGEKTGVLPEGTTAGAEKLKEFNPSVSLAGELASFAVPGLGEIKALGKAGQLISKTGLAQKAVGAVGSKIGEVAGKAAGKQLGAIAAPATKLAAEASVFQAAHNISEESLQNRDLTVESVLSHVGDAALLGGGIGAGLPIALRAGKAAAGAALDFGPVRWAADKLGKQAADFLDPQRAAQLYSGGMSKGELLRDTPKGMKFKDSVKYLWDDGAYKGGTVDLGANGKLVHVENGKLLNQGEMLERFNQLQEKAGARIGEVLEEADQAAVAAGVNPATNVFGRAEAKAIDAELNQLRKTRQITEATSDRIANEVKDIARGINGARSLKELHEIRRGLDARIGGKNFEKIETSEEIDVIKNIRRMLSQKIDDGFSQLETAGIAKGTDAWRNTNQLYRSLANVTDKLDFQVARGNANVNVGGLRWRDLMAGTIGASALGPAGALIGVGNHLLQTDAGLLMRAHLGDKLHTLGWLTKATAAAKNNIGKSVAQFVKSINPDAIANTAVKALGTGAARIESLGMPAYMPAMAQRKTTPEERHAENSEWFKKTASLLQSVASDPQGFAQKQSDQLTEIAANAPKTASDIVQKQMQLYSYLLNVMPKNPGDPFTLAHSEWAPAEYEIDRFRDVVRVAAQPLAILHELRQGTVSRPQVQAVSTLYPSLYQQMYNAVISTVTDGKASLSYDKRLQLGKLFPGVEQSLSPDFIASMQQGSAQEEPESKSPSGYRASGIKTSSSTAERYATKTERLGAR